MNKIIIFIGIVAVAILAGCSASAQTHTDLTVSELQSLLQDEDVYLIDVHTPRQEHLPGTDAVIPYNEIIERLDELPRDQKIVLYCRSGSMSRQAAEELAAEGFDVYNLLGGRNAWVQFADEPSLTSKTTGTTGMGDVAIELTPSYVDGRLVVTTTINTHSVSLSEYDLTAITILTVDDQEYRPVSAPSMSGHHVTGEMVFEVAEKPSSFSLVIEGIPAVQERKYQW